MRALITGGAGFIGSHLAEELLRRNHEVMAIDDLSTGQIENIRHLKDLRSFSYTIGTIQDRPLLAELVDEADVVFHMAAAVGVRLIIERPVETIETNVRGTEIVLELAAKKGKKVIIASTSEVYGKGTAFPFREDADLVIGPTSKSRWSYACSKTIDEFLALAYRRERGVPVVIVRFFNTVGPRQTGRYGMVVPNFVKQALSGDPITVFGTGQQSRCFTAVSDAVRAVIDLSEEPEAVGEVFNIGSDREVTIEQLARLVRQQTGSSSDVVFVPYDQAYEEGFEDMPRRVPDLTKIRRVIGYEPTVALPKILDEVIDYFRHRPRERW